MCNHQENHKLEGAKERVPKRISPVLLFAIALVTILLVIPLVQETRIYIRVEHDSIDDAWVETIRVPLISMVFPPTHKVGVYTINVTIEPSGDMFTLEDIPSGEHVIVWSNVQSGINYTITITLIREELIVHTFELNVSF